jgi:hypothetical protein
MAEEIETIDPLAKFRRPQKPGSPSIFKRRSFDEFDLLSVGIKTDLDNCFYYEGELEGKLGYIPIKESDLYRTIDKCVEKWLDPKTLTDYGINYGDDLYVLFTSEEFIDQCKGYLKHRHKPTLTSQYNSSMKKGSLEKKELPEFVTWKKEEKISINYDHFFGKQIILKQP